MRLLIAEDEPKLLEALVTVFRKNRYEAEGVTRGDDALAYAITGQYDGLVLDIMMPGTDGITVISELRRRGVQTPVLLLTARTSVSDRVAGLDAGADDYLPKPFSMEELLARVRAMLRRREEYTPDRLTLGDLVLSSADYTLSALTGDASLTLSRREYQIMEVLMRAGGAIVPTAALFERVWGLDTDVDTGIVFVYITGLRKKLAALHVRTALSAVRGRGYTLKAGGSTR